MFGDSNKNQKNNTQAGGPVPTAPDGSPLPTVTPVGSGLAMPKPSPMMSTTAPLLNESMNDNDQSMPIAMQSPPKEVKDEKIDSNILTIQPPEEKPLPPLTSDDTPEPEPKPTSPLPPPPAPAMPPLNGGGDLLGIKQQALQKLAPLVDKLDQTPEEKFKTTMMLIQASDNSELVPKAFEAANTISDEKTRAQALLDVVNEINYFTQKKSK